MLETLPLGSQVRIEAWNFVSEPDGIGYSGAYEDYVFDGVVAKVFNEETVKVLTHHSGNNKLILFKRHLIKDNRIVWTGDDCIEYEDVRITGVRPPHTPEIICVSYPVAESDEVDIYIGPEQNIYLEPEEISLNA